MPGPEGRSGGLPGLNPSGRGIRIPPATRHAHAPGLHALTRYAARLPREERRPRGTTEDDGRLVMSPMLRVEKFAGCGVKPSARKFSGTV